MHSIKGLDVFKKLSTDHVPQTALGGVFTLIAVFTMLGLFLFELNVFLTPTFLSETIVDSAREDRIRVNLDLLLPYIPCAMISVDLQDEAGAHNMDVSGTLQKISLDASGTPYEKQDPDGSLQGVRKAISLQDQCRLQGYLMVGTVPGNFHISFHSQHVFVHQLPRHELIAMKFDHVVGHLSFGSELKEFVSEEELHSIFSPYDDLRVKLPNDGVYNYEYFIKIIPLQYVDESTGLQLNSYMFSMNHQNKLTNSAFGAVYFRYDIDCVTVRYIRKVQSLTHFLINICAILGGVFCVIGIGHSLTQQALKITKVS